MGAGPYLTGTMTGTAPSTGLFMNKIIAFTYQEPDAAVEEIPSPSPIIEENERMFEAETFEAAIQAQHAWYYAYGTVYFGPHAARG